MNNLSLSVFFPAYNEEKNIQETLLRGKEAAKKVASTYELIVVNDGSSDKTGAIADALAGEDPAHVRVVHHQKNLGYGAALKSGIAAARHDYVFFTDADLQFDLKELPLLAAHVGDYPAVIGYRAPRRDPFMRLVNAWGWNLLNRFLFGLKARDIDCAFKLFERRLLAALPLKAEGAMLSAEMLIRLSRKGVPVKEVPVTHLPRKAGSPTGAKLSVILRAFKEMLFLFRTELGSKEMREFFKFGSVGAVNTAIDLGFYVILTRLLFFGNDLVLAKGLSYMAGTIFSFVANRVFTFGIKRPIHPLEIGRFYVSVALALLINTGSTYLFINVFHLYDLLAAFLATVCTILWNFTSLKFWVYDRAPAFEKSPVRRMPEKI